MRCILKLFVVIIVFSGCGPIRKVRPDKITSTKAFKSGFYLYRLDVTALRNGRPVKYSIEERLYCGPLEFLQRFYRDSNIYVGYTPAQVDMLKAAKKTTDSVVEINNYIFDGHEKGADQLKRSEHIIDSLERLRFSFIPQKTVYFHKKNTYYRWIFCEEKKGDLDNLPNYSEGIYETIPIQFLADQWYLLDFSNDLGITDEVYFYIDRKGNIHQYRVFKERFFV